MIIFACSCYFIALYWSYAFVDSIVYRGLGFLYTSLPYKVLLIAFAMAVLPSLWMPIELRHPSRVCYWLLYLCVVVPTMFLPYHILNYQDIGDVFPLPASILAMFMILGLSYRFPTFRIARPNLDQKLLVGLMVLLSAALIGLVIYTSGFHFSFSLDSAYERRMDARESVGGGSLRAYAVATLSHSLGPLLIAIGYVRRNIVTFSVGILGAICIFSLAGTKTDIATPVYLFALLVLVSSYRKHFGIVIVLASAALVIVSAAQFLLLERNDLSVYFVRRQIFIPSLLTCFYWDFFSYNDYVYFSDSFLRAFIPRQYDLPMSRLIGEAYFGNAASNANANIWASAFANVGYTGMFIFTVILGILFRFIDGIAKHSDFFVTSLMCGMFGLTWTNGGLQTSMLSNGIFVTLCVIYLLQPIRPIALRSAPLRGVKNRSRSFAPIRHT